MVGRPSVRKMITKGRSISDFGFRISDFEVCASSRRLPPGRNASAFRKASSIAVPPMAFKSLMKSSARARLAFDASASLLKSSSVSVEKRMISKRSSSFRFSTQNSSAFFACSSFLPAIEPEVSSTKATSFGITFVSFASMPGDASSRK